MFKLSLTRLAQDWQEWRKFAAALHIMVCKLRMMMMMMMIILSWYIILHIPLVFAGCHEPLSTSVWPDLSSVVIHFPLVLDPGVCVHLQMTHHSEEKYHITHTLPSN